MLALAESKAEAQRLGRQERQRQRRAQADVLDAEDADADRGDRQSVACSDAVGADVKVGRILKAIGRNQILKRLQEAQIAQKL